MPYVASDPSTPRVGFVLAPLPLYSCVHAAHSARALPCCSAFSAGVLSEMRSRLVAGLKRYYHAKRMEGLLSVQVGCAAGSCAATRRRLRAAADSPGEGSVKFGQAAC